MNKWPKVASFLSSYAEIFFIKGSLPGLILLVLGLFNLKVALSGCAVVAVAYTFAWLIGWGGFFFNTSLYTYNALFIGFSVGALFKWDTQIGLILGTAGVLSFVVTRILSHLFEYYLGLDVLSLPFIIVSGALYLAVGRHEDYISPFLSQAIVFHPWIDAFFRSLGSIVFLPQVGAGICIALIILASSRLLFGLSIVGFIWGSVVTGIYLGSIPSGFMQLGNFNYCLVAMALGGIYLIPSIQSYSIALLAVMVSTLVSNALGAIFIHYGLPVFTLPFVLITLSFVYMLRVVQYRFLPGLYKATPEETLDYFLTLHQRLKLDFGIPLPPMDPFYDQATQLSWGSKMTFDVYHKNKPIRTMALQVSVANDGTFYLETTKAKLYFGRLDGAFFCYHMAGYDKDLAMIYLAFSKIPLCFLKAQEWTDGISSLIFLKGYRRWVLGLIQSFWPKAVETTTKYRYSSPTEIAGEISNIFFNHHVQTYVKLDPELQLAVVRVGHDELRRRIG